MATRTFVVFQDPSSPVKTAIPRPLGRTASAGAVLSSSRLSENSSGAVGNLPTSSSSAAEKENMNPITGLGVRSALGKKRKASENNVLATKMLACEADTTATAGAKSLKSKPLNARADLKRKALSDAGGSEKTKVKRESAKRSGSSTASASSNQRRTRSASKLLLETIKEEIPNEGAVSAAEGSEEEAGTQKQESTKQALINSKCRDLTVSPLANVTDAYTQSSDHVDATVAKDENPTPIASEEDLFFSSSIRDYFAPKVARKKPNHRPLSASSSFSLFDACGPRPTLPSMTSKSTVDSTDEPVTPTKPKGLSRSMSLPAISPCRAIISRDDGDDDEVKSTGFNTLLSTPQRKELYASFTFSSPGHF